MGTVLAGKRLYLLLRQSADSYLFNDDPLAAIANRGAFLVWSSQPLYPLYVWFLVGRDAWPSLLTWLSTPFFYLVALVGRAHPLASRIVFVIAGLLNTLLSVKAFGTATLVGWFIVPCFVIAATFFRTVEWGVSLALCIACVGAALAVPYLGAPFHVYSADQARSLSHLNLSSVVFLSAYLFYCAVRVRSDPADGR